MPKPILLVVDDQPEDLERTSRELTKRYVEDYEVILTGPDLVGARSAAGERALSRPPLLLETSMPGVFAAGDVRHGSVKRVAAAVGEGGIAIQSVHQYLASS